MSTNQEVGYTKLEKTNLAGFSHAKLVDFFLELGEPAFRAVQVLKWIHKYGVTDFQNMTNLSKVLREKLSTIAVVEFPKIIEEIISVDGTHKWLIQVTNGKLIETVFIPEQKRGTLCISSQVGCGLNCAFCSTATIGYKGNLTSAEIIGQLWLAVRALEKIQRITNVVMMGMGEPLLNLDAVVDAIAIMRDDNSYNLARRRVTVSTSGIIPKIAELSAKADVALAISLHAPNDTLRDILVPINKKYPISELMNACKKYLQGSKIDSITIEYVMLKGINDKIMHARQLIKILSNFACKVNLIPFNEFVGSKYQCSNDEDIYNFNRILNNAGIVTTTRTPRGSDIQAACGQLAKQNIKMQEQVYV